MATIVKHHTKKRKIIKRLSLARAIRKAPKVIVDLEDMRLVIERLNIKRSRGCDGRICSCGTWVVKENRSDNGCIHCTFKSNHSGVILKHMTKGYEDNLHNLNKDVCRGIDTNLSDIVSRLTGELSVFSNINY